MIAVGDFKHLTFSFAALLLPADLRLVDFSATFMACAKTLTASTLA
jgi:hypothetical protein